MTRALPAVFVITVMVVVSVLVSVAQVPDSVKPDPAALRNALAQRTSQLGVCNSELGQLQQLSAQMMTGKIRDVAETVAAIKAAFEKVNPGKTFSADFVIQDVVKPANGKDRP